MSRHNQSTKAWYWECGIIALLATMGQIYILANPLGA